MSTLYEDELNRLIGELSRRIEELQKRGGSDKEVKRLQGEVEVLKERLESYRKAMIRFRAKQPVPTPSHGAPQS